MRTSLFGGDKGRKTGDDHPLDPEKDAARIRAFFVHPSSVRQGIGRGILLACEKAMLEARFHKVELSATLSGEILYAAHGYQVVERYEIPMVDGLGLPVVRMAKRLKRW